MFAAVFSLLLGLWVDLLMFGCLVLWCLDAYWYILILICDADLLSGFCMSKLLWWL